MRVRVCVCAHVCAVHLCVVGKLKPQALTSSSLKSQELCAYAQDFFSDLTFNPLSGEDGFHCPTFAARVRSGGHVQVAGGVTNLLVNPSFEEDLSGNWQSFGFSMVRHSEDKVHGDYSVKCTGR